MHEAVPQMRATTKKRSLAYEEEPPPRTAPPRGKVFPFHEVARLPASGDNAAIVTRDLVMGTGVQTGDETVWLQSTVIEGHRFAVGPIAEGELLLSWGEPFGKALRPIAPGEWLRNAKCLTALSGRLLGGAPIPPSTRRRARRSACR